MFRLDPRRLLLLGCFFLWMFAGCVPEDLAGPSRDEGGKDDLNDGVDIAHDPPRFSFAISSSASTPNVHTGAPASGPYDLYLWLVCSNYGLGHLQADFDVSGDALVADHFFTAEAGVVSIVWDEFGELNLAIPGCPQTQTLLGRLHLEGSGTGGRIGMRRPSTDMGAVDCTSESRVSGFSCVGYASDGNPPPQEGGLDACVANQYGSSLQFTISASRTDPYQQTAPPVDGPVVLWLWSISGSFAALQGDVSVAGGIGGFDPLFSAEPPYLNLNMTDGPDVLLASPGCSWGTNLLGSLLVVDDGAGVTVAMSPGAEGGAVDCDTDPHAHSFVCRPFSSR